MNLDIFDSAMVARNMPESLAQFEAWLTSAGLSLRQIVRAQRKRAIRADGPRS